MSTSLHAQKTGLYVMASLVLAGTASVFALNVAAPQLWLACVVVTAAAVGGVTSMIIARGKAGVTIDERANLTDDEVFGQYLSHTGLSKPMGLELWHEAAVVFGVPAGKLRPTDRFGHELGAHGLTSEALDQLAALASRRGAAKGVTLNLKAVETLGDYVEELGRKLGG